MWVHVRKIFRRDRLQTLELDTTQIGQGMMLFWCIMVGLLVGLLSLHGQAARRGKRSRKVRVPALEMRRDDYLPGKSIKSSWESPPPWAWFSCAAPPGWFVYN